MRALRQRVETGNALRRGGDQQVLDPDRQDDAHNARDQCQHDALGDEQGDHAKACGAKRQPHGHLAPPSDTPRK
jgi:hypothetical protein